MDAAADSIQWWGQSWCYKSLPTGGGSGFVAMESGYNFLCALNGAGAVECWGQNDHFGQLDVPADVAAGNQVAVATGQFFACAVSSAGAVECWGLNEQGSTIPPAFTDPQVAICAGAFASAISVCAVARDALRWYAAVARTRVVQHRPYHACYF